MDNGRKGKIDYIRLVQAIWGHWKPVFQNKEFRKEMFRWITGTVIFTAGMIFMLSLDPTGKVLGELMKEIEPPPGAVKMGGGGMREGLNSFYKFPGMSGEEVRLYYKKELKKKKWKYKGRDRRGDDIYVRYSDIYLKYGDKTPYIYILVFQDCRPSSKEYDYDWILNIYKFKSDYEKSIQIATPPEKEDEEEQEGLFFGGGQR